LGLQFDIREALSIGPVGEGGVKALEEDGMVHFSADDRPPLGWGYNAPGSRNSLTGPLAGDQVGS
jgi:hypothetical protein